MTAAVASPTTCERVQLQLVDGRLDDDGREHADACPECGFFLSLSRGLGDSRKGHDTAGGGDAALGALLTSVLERGELLSGRYRLQTPIGRGGQGRVFRALDEETGEVVAVKVVRLHERDPSRSAQEVALARRIRHPNVCRVFHTERHGAIRLIVLELVEGATLRGCMRELDVSQRLAVFLAVCAGVHAAHEAGVLHLDLKPDNVLMREGQTPVVTDFGLSRRLDRDAPLPSSGGTPAYMAPEQQRGGAVDRRTDVYALGRLLAELFPHGPRWIRSVVACACAAQPEDRFADVAALISAFGRRRTRLRTLAIGVVTLAAVGGVIAASQSKAEPQARGAWRDAWGLDTIAADAVDVALNRAGTGLPRASASHDGWGCGQNLAELVDGITQYSSWEHGFAFPAAPEEADGACLSFDLLAPHGHCGALRPEANLCEQIEGGGHRVLDARVADLDRQPPARRPALGQLEPFVTPCGERWLEVQLAAPARVFAVRTWHHGFDQVPRSYRIDVHEREQWHTVFATQQNEDAIDPDHHDLRVANGASAPITAEFTAVATDRVRFVMDSCTTRGVRCRDRWIDAAIADRAACPPGHGWLYEIEVFALPE